ncbi:sulfurtransferase complex subunit TusC [Glaciecola siphonariae]|uniref:Sulfurtransferase complex subunit TusC n=1 Tax=Glaciecola siphonariae TaxID=521012 RepID=A0ABV9LT17_9ALTE
MNPYLLIITCRPPYHSSSDIDAFEAALAASNVGLEVKFLFKDDGILQLLPSQAPEHIHHKNTFKKLSALPLFDVSDIFVCHHSVRERDIVLAAPDDSTLNWQMLDKAAVVALIQSASNVLVF